MNEIVDPLECSVRCCQALNASGLLRAPVSPRSDTGRRLRDLAGASELCEIVVYWGIWRQGEFGCGETELLFALSRLARLVENTLRIAVTVQIVVTDTHARLNGVTDAIIDAALDELRAGAPCGTVLTRMSEIAPPSAEPRALETLRTIPGGPRLLEQVYRQAAKLFGGAEAHARADAYVATNLHEAAYVLARWPAAVFLHIGPPELAFMLPSLPMLHGYAGAQGRTRKPWFS